MQQQLTFRRTTILMIAMTALLAGLGLARLQLSVHFAWILLFLMISAVSLPRKRLLGVVSISIACLLLGIWRGSAFMQEIAVYDTLANEKVVVRVTAEQDAVYNENKQLEFDGGDVVFDDPYYGKVPGRIKVSGFGEPAVYRGDVVQVEGKLFRTRGSRQASISFGEIKVLGRSASPVEAARRSFVAGMLSALPEPQASFGLGLLIGQRTTLPDSLTEMLSIVGLTHIIAVSGYNLTIIVRAVMRLGKRLSKFQILILASSLVVLFLLVTGFSASIVRAAIVSMLSLGAWYYGRTIRPLLVLLITAALTAWWYPLYLWSDIGWYLSFLAFFGVLILAPLIAKRYWKHEPKIITSIVLESLCAQLLTLPLILYIFEETSLIALLSNVIVVPLVPLAMLFSLIAGIAGVFMPAIAGWFAWPARVILTYIIDMVQLLSRVPYARIQRSLTITGLIILYLAIALYAFVLWRRTKDGVKITDKNSVL